MVVGWLELHFCHIDDFLCWCAVSSFAHLWGFRNFTDTCERKGRTDLGIASQSLKSQRRLSGLGEHFSIGQNERSAFVACDCRKCTSISWGIKVWQNNEKHWITDKWTCWSLSGCTFSNIINQCVTFHLVRMSSVMKLNLNFAQLLRACNILDTRVEFPSAWQKIVCHK